MSQEVQLFDICKNDQVGRYVVANTDLKPGDMIFSEDPFAYGPKSDHPPMCLGCYLPVDCTYLCSSCQWPVCGQQCEIIKSHKEAECKIFSKENVKFQKMDDTTQICHQYECITPLRVLLAKEANPEIWENQISKMESHNEKRKSTEIWNFNQNNIIKYLRGPCKQTQFSEEIIHTVCGILEVNAFEANPFNGGYSIRCLYHNLALLSHNCISNITHSIIPDENFKVIVRAAVNVTSGQQLYSSYTSSLQPTLVRRKILKHTKYFDCSCKRCSDPTELGTHMGTIKCSKCDNGVVLSTAPLDFNASWKCTHCEFSTNAKAVQRVYEAIQADIDNVDAYVTDASEAIEAREALYRKYRSVLHPQNAFHTLLRMSLAQMYGKIEGYNLEELPDLLLERKMELCQLLLQNLDILEPGYTRSRGLIIYELHAPIILLARNLFRNGCINKEQLRNKLGEAIKLLGEAADILTLEPANSPEGMLGQGAVTAKQQLLQNIEELVNAEF